MIVRASGTPKSRYMRCYRVLISWTGLSCQEGSLHLSMFSLKQGLIQILATLTCFVTLQNCLQCGLVEPGAMPVRTRVHGDALLSFCYEEILAFGAGVM